MNKIRLSFLLMLFIGVSIRMINVTLPLIDHHSFRQCDTAAIAKNFYEERFNILYPRVDWRGNTEGYVECEFPIYNFLIAALYKIFYPTDTIARLLSITFYIGTFFFLFFLAKGLYDNKTALWSCFILSFLPENIYFTRTVMPESTMLFFSIGMVCFLLKWSDTDRFKYFIVSMVFFSVALLIKLPTLYLSLLIIYCLYKKFKFKILFKFRYIFVVLCSLIPVALWYFHAHYALDKITGITFGMWNFGGRLAEYNLLTDIKFYRMIYGRLCSIVLTDVGFWLFVCGLIFGIYKQKQNIIRVWVFAVLLYIVGAAQDNYRHDYYQLPIVLPASILIGTVINFLFKRNKIEINGRLLRNNFTIILGCLCVFFFLNLSWENLQELSGRRFYNLYNAGKAAEKILPQKSLIITCTDGIHVPEILYYAHRKGWFTGIDTNPDHIKELVDKGAEYFILVADDELSQNVEKLNNIPLVSFLKSNFKVIYNTNYCLIFKLK